MYNHQLHHQLHGLVKARGLDIAGADNAFYTRLMANGAEISELYDNIYSAHPRKEEVFQELLGGIIDAYCSRPAPMKLRDAEKQQQEHWYLSNEIAAMSLYVDRFCGNIKDLRAKLPYFEELGVNMLHLMPVFSSPPGESDGGYAVSDFRTVDKRFGSLKDLQQLQAEMMKKGMYLMLDIVLNHTSHHHEWARRAREGETQYQGYYYMFPDRTVPDQYDHSMPEIFPEAAPGNFTYVPECEQWVMTVFHQYQWDLNYRNPEVFVRMLENIFFYANLGVDLLRIDAPAFIWKELGTTCQNLPQAHTLLRLIRQCVDVATPGMALLGEAIVAPAAIMKYFGTDRYLARECSFAYNATHMALQWDALATQDTRVMLAAQYELLQKPYGASWITYTRCHDDIGLGYEDDMIRQAGYDPYQHRKFIKDYYSGTYGSSPARGALFSVNPKTQDARISGSLASLCGLEAALDSNNGEEKELALRKIIMMQAHSIFLGGIPMLFYGDELAYTNDYSYLDDAGKSYDNRWMHRPKISWQKNKKRFSAGTVEHRVFSETQKLLQIRKQHKVFGDMKNLEWIRPYNIHVAGYVRTLDQQAAYLLFNFSKEASYLRWRALSEFSGLSPVLKDLWSNREIKVGDDHEHLVLDPYQFMVLM